MKKYTDYVNMFFGTRDHSLCTIGPERPNSSVCPCPDTTPQSYSTGYLSNAPICGFSHIHVNAGEPKYGNFLFSPQIGLSTESNSHCSEKRNERPTAAEYSVTLAKYNIDVSFTPAEHSVIYKFKYPKSTDASFIVDAEHYLRLHSNMVEDIHMTVGTDEFGRTVIYGSGLFDNPKYHLYFYAVCNKTPKETGTFIGEKTFRNSEVVIEKAEGEELVGAGTYLRFDTEENEEILIKVGISFGSVEKAKVWLYSEIPEWDYDKVKRETESLWERELSKIEIAPETPEKLKKMFYTSLYVCHKMPRDRTGDINKFGDAEMIDDHIAVWDTFRTLYPLYTITNPDFVAKTVNSFVTRLRVNGCVRDIINAGNERMRNQGGDNTDNIIVEAYLKGIDGVDWNEAYKVIKSNADEWRDDQNDWQPIKKASTYRDVGFIPADDKKTWVMCCSKQLEYSYNDFLASLMAKALGHNDDYEMYFKRSESWKTIWNPNIECNGFRGFVWPKNKNGSFVKPNDILPSADTRCLSWCNYFYEGTSFEYSFFVPHDIETLIEKMGGENEFNARIEYGMKNGIIWPGNQPGLIQAYLPNYTSEPWHTSELVRLHLDRYTEKGTPGCEDSGCMCSWYVFSAMGIFPCAGQDFYFLSSPSFKSVKINLPNGKIFTIQAKNLSEENKYIQSVMLNGKKYNKAFIRHRDIINGGSLVINMGETPVNYTK